MKKTVLGIDTSCYTTSLALFKDDVLLADERKMLPVAQGAKGLRQSEGVYHHHRNMPRLLERIVENLHWKNLGAIAYSATPRPVEGSYMPVFTAGEDFAKTLSSALGIPLISRTHQEGHVRAAVWSSKLDDTQPFIAVHLSGGTTEILKISKENNRYQIDIIGGTKDISAGMVLDRVGVELGFSFPAGKYMDQLALESNRSEKPFAVSVKGPWVHFSGLENSAMRHYGNTQCKEEVAYETLNAIARSLAKALMNIVEIEGKHTILFTGGVGASQYLRRFFEESKKYRHLKPIFCEGRYSVDNAVGIAAMGADIMRGTC